VNLKRDRERLGKEVIDFPVKASLKKISKKRQGHF
jgi:hypothetical protein